MGEWECMGEVGAVVHIVWGAGLNSGMPTAEPDTKKHTSHGRLRYWGPLLAVALFVAMP